MIRRLFLVAALAIVSTPALAQQWTVGDQGAVWTTPGDPTTVMGSAPADAYEPAEVALPAGVNLTDWLISTGDQLTTDKVGNPKSYYKSLTDGERKIRITCEPSTLKTKDNILGKGISLFGHPHQGYGMVNWDENTDYTSARNNPSSTCAGGPLNATNYMEPALLKPLANGLIVSVLAQDQADYYVEGNQSDPNVDTWLRRGMQFVVGSNPKNFNDTARRAAYAAGGLLYPGSPVSPAGVNGWYCVLANGSTAPVTDTTAQMQGDSGVHKTGNSRYLRGPNGEDPWGGGCTGTDAAPASMTTDILAPGCWDRYNLTAPDGRGHLWYQARKSDNSVVGACPKTTAGGSYARVPRLEVKNIFTTTGFADYGTWYFMSDRTDYAQTVTSGCTNDPTTHADSCSISPCRSTGPYFCNGETEHADYTLGWDTTDAFDQMERECLGITVRGIAPTDGPAECNASQVDRYHGLKYGTSPNPLYSGGCTVILSCKDSVPTKPLERYILVPEMTQGSVTIEHHH